MADLDDFFAKKDRKKSSKTKKFSTTDEVAKKLEDTTKKPEKTVKKERPQENEDGTPVVHEQDEWKDFEEEKKDYTGLKIGNLTINPEMERNNGTQDENLEQQQTYDEAGNEIEKKASGPWKRVGDGTTQVEAPVVEEKKTSAPPVEVASTNVVAGTYVPPGMRNQPSQPHTMVPSRLRSKAAPDIHNEDFFPTLAGSKRDQTRGRNEGSFEMVSHSKSSSIRQTEQAKNSGQGAKLTLGNRYNTLSNDS